MAHLTHYMRLERAIVKNYTAVGVSAHGARQFAAGEAVANPQDRMRLARLMEAALDLVNRQNGGSAVTLLIPAVQMARESARP